MQQIERFLANNGIKKKWFAKAIGISAEMLRHYFKNHKELPVELKKKGIRALDRHSRKVHRFVKREK